MHQTARQSAPGIGHHPSPARGLFDDDGQRGKVGCDAEEVPEFRVLLVESLEFRVSFERKVGPVDPVRE